MNGYRYGGFGRRAIAMSVDGVLLYTFIFSMFYLARHLLSATGFGGAQNTTGLLYYLGLLLLNMTYYTFFHGVGGQTPGKMIMGIKVIRSTGEEMTPGFAFLRWVGYLVSQLFFCLGFLWVAFDRKKQGWHDIIAGTVVIRTRGQGREQAGQRGVGNGPLPAFVPPETSTTRPAEYGLPTGHRGRFPY